MLVIRIAGGSTANSVGDGACPCRKSNTNVVMMQAAEERPRFDAPEGVNRSPRRRILVQGQVCSALIVVARIRLTIATRRCNLKR